ncbi:MAG: hypothetical protein JSV33_05285 [bacterium]|nr:MAG: hypothetical protein JSV33_05285 [bacterium]
MVKRKVRSQTLGMKDLFRDEVFETVLDHMEKRFDSHDFIFEMMRRFPRHYTHTLYECRRAKDPIQTLHAKIGRKLLEYGGRLRKTRRKSSRNVRGLPSANQFWEKTEVES